MVDWGVLLGNLWCRVGVVNGVRFACHSADVVVDEGVRFGGLGDWVMV